MEISETKKLAEIFCEAFLIFNKIISLSRPGVIFAFLKRLFSSTCREDWVKAKEF
jgi:hypothetical protein